MFRNMERIRESTSSHEIIKSSDFSNSIQISSKLSALIYLERNLYVCASVNRQIDKFQVKGT